jgi:hypothetical protein
MVRAILNGTKSQSRRVIKPQPVIKNNLIEWNQYIAIAKDTENISKEFGLRCPYGQVGDEEWQSGMPPSDGFYHVQTFDKPIFLRRMMKTDYPNQDVEADGLLWGWDESDDPEAIELADLTLKTIKWKRVGDRLWVRETWYWDKPHKDSVLYKASLPNWIIDAKWRPSIFMPRWASRINLEITEVRVERLNQMTEEDVTKEGVDNLVTFILLWDRLNKKRGYEWKNNIWVWVITFKLCL